MSSITQRKMLAVSGGLNVLSFVLSATALLATIWIIVPAPFYNVWLLSILASEWSLLFGVLALFGIAAGFAARAASRKLRFVSVAMGVFAVLLSLYPVFSAYSTAQKQGISLSLRRYFAGFTNFKNNDSAQTKLLDYTTHTFVNAERNELRLDAYLPPDNIEANGAGIIVVHSGSWNAGERNEFPQWNEWFARQGFAVFDIDYRLAPQPNYVTATGDVKCAVNWVKRHSSKFGISPDRIALLGRSAGGHLALLAAYSAGDSRLPSSCQNSNIDFDISPNENVRAVVSFYAPTDLLWSYDHPANRFVIDGPATLRRFLGGNPHESEEMRQRFLLASPVNHVNPLAPPTLLVHGGQDQLVSDKNAELLDAKLGEAHVPHKLLFIPYAQHGFDYNFNGWGSQIVQTVMRDFLGENTKEQ